AASSGSGRGLPAAVPQPGTDGLGAAVSVAAAGCRTDFQHGTGHGSAVPGTPLDCSAAGRRAAVPSPGIPTAQVTGRGAALCQFRRAGSAAHGVPEPRPFVTEYDPEPSGRGRSSALAGAGGRRPAAGRAAVQ